MNKLLSVITLFVIINSTNAQSFEGVITYAVTYELKGKFLEMKDKIEQQMQDSDDFFDTVRVYIKEGNYKKLTNTSGPTSLIYKADENKIYNLQEGFEYVTIADGNKLSSSKIVVAEPDFSYVDTVVNVSGIPCEAIRIGWGSLGEEWYFYNAETAVINPDLFMNHKYEYFDIVTKNTGAFPLEMVKSMGEAMSVRFTMVAIEEKEIADQEFDIPKLKKADKQMIRIMGAISTNQVMKIKN